MRSDDFAEIIDQVQGCIEVGERRIARTKGNLIGDAIAVKRECGNKVFLNCIGKQHRQIGRADRCASQRVGSRVDADKIVTIAKSHFIGRRGVDHLGSPDCKASARSGICNWIQRGICTQYERTVLRCD